jgi:outer membrane protein assembly factor BamB
MLIKIDLGRVAIAWCCLLAWTLLPITASAQFRTRTTSLRATSAASSLRTLGMERMWQAQIEFDPSRGSLAGLTQHISDTNVQRLVEVTYPGGRTVFSERDLDAFARPLGAQGARRKAQEWINLWKLRTKSEHEPEVNEIVVPDVTLIATSSRGIVQCLNGETGETRWTVQVGSTRHPTTRAAVNENHVAVINGTTLYLLQRSDGRIVWERSLGHSPGAGPALSEELVFVPMVSGMIEAYFIDEPRRPAATFHATGRCIVQPTVFRDSVAWPTDKGNLYVGNAHMPGIRFRVTANDVIHAAPTFRAGSSLYPELVIFASADGNVYAAETNKGAIVYRFSTGESISQTPVVVKDHVYIVTDEGTFFALNANDGQELWWTAGMKTFVSANFDRVYCLDLNDRLVAFDAKTGSLLGATDVGNVSYVFVNTESDRIYLATTRGVVQGLRESRQRYPLVHGGLEPKRELPQALSDEAPADTLPEDAPPVRPRDTNPFGEDEPMEDDPFSADDMPADDSDTMPDAMEDDDDPFR